MPQTAGDQTDRRRAFRVSRTDRSPRAGAVAQHALVHDSDNNANLAGQQLLGHALFHRIEPELGFVTETTTTSISIRSKGASGCSSIGGRSAGQSSSGGSDRAPAIADALAFRRERRRLFPGAADNERRDEIREGLASYTGIAAWATRLRWPPSRSVTTRRSGRPDVPGRKLRRRIGTGLRCAAGRSPAGWRRPVHSTSDLGDMLASATNRPATTDVAVAAARYDAATLRTAEEARDGRRRSASPSCMVGFVDGSDLSNTWRRQQGDAPLIVEN